MKKTQKGFTFIEVLVVLVVLFLIGFVGYKARQGRPAKGNTSSASSRTTAVSNTESLPSVMPGTEDWKIYTASGKGFNYGLKLPEGWTAETLINDGGEGPGNGISVSNTADKSGGFVFSAVLDPQFYQDQLKSDDLNYAWSLFKSQGLKAVVEANRQTTIKSLAANKYIKDKTVGPLERIAIAEGESWGYTVNESYGTGFKDDLISGSIVEKPSTVVFVSNGRIVLQGVIITDDSTQTKIIQTLKIW